MLIMYRGFELVPIKDGEKWQAQVFSGSKPVGATALCADEEAAMREAKKMADDYRSRRSA
jgi:hypothetical protein